MRATPSRHRFGLLAGLGVLVVGALGLAGCVQISAENHSQLNTVGSVRLDTTVCTSGTTGCVDTSKTGNASGTGNTQMMVAYRVPTAAVAPATILSLDTVVTLSQNAQYAAEMQRLFPAPAGQKWVGYLGSTQTFSTAAGVQSFDVQPEFQLGQGANGTPFQSPFTYRTVVGLRSVAAGFPSNRPVVCETLTTDTRSADLSTTCFDSPNVATIGTNLSQDTLDLGVAAGAAATGSVGGTVPVAFTLNYSGTSTTTANFSISGASTLPGAIVAPSLGNLQPPTNSSTPVFANVTIPGGAAAGTYSVSLKASLANGQSRTNSVPLTIPLRVAFTLPKNLTAVTARKTGIRITVVARSRGAATFKVFQGKAGKPAIITKRLTLKKGKNVIVLRSAKLKKGKYRINASGVSLNLNKTGSLK